jgi:hypothetical protein
MALFANAMRVCYLLPARAAAVGVADRKKVKKGKSKPKDILSLAGYSTEIGAVGYKNVRSPS